MQVQNRQSVTVDLRRSMTMPVPRYRQYDTNILEITIMDNQQPADLSNVTRITAAYKRPDKEVVSRMVSKEGNVLTYQIGKEECDYPGKGELMIQFYEGDQRLSTMKMQVIIDSSFEPNIEGTEDLQLLQELFIEVDTRLADINRTNEIYQVNEVERQENETTRQEQEAARVVAENEREAAETIRQEQESTRQINTTQAISDAESATQYAATQGDYAKEQGDYAKTQGDAAAQRLAELNNADAAQLDDRLTEVEGRLSETGRHTQILKPGVNILEADVAAPVDFEIQGRTLVSMANSNLKPSGQYVIADEKIKVRDIDGRTHSGIGKFQRPGLATKEDFSKKTTGNTTTNPHISSYSIAKTELRGPNEQERETLQTGYDKINTLNGLTADASAPTIGGIGQITFSFNVIEAIERKIGRIPSANKAQWLRDNLDRMTFNWYGYGSGPNGNKASLGYWKRDANEWGTSSIWSKTNSKPELISILFLSTIPNVIDDEGKLHVIAYADPSDGTTPSSVSTDYVSLDVQLKATAQLDTRPSIIRVENFEGKVAGSTVENPHASKYQAATGLIAYNGIAWAAWTDNDSFKVMSKLDGTTRAVSSRVDGVMAQQLFSFNVIEAVERNIGKIPRTDTAGKVEWLRENLTSITCNWWGYGRNQSGFRASITRWSFVLDKWFDTSIRSHSADSVAKLSYNTLDMVSAIGEDGFTHFVAYAEPTDTTLNSSIYTDYVELEFELKPSADFHSPKVPLYEVAQAEYDKIGSEWSDADVKARFPVVEGVQHLQNLYVMAEGENLFPPFHEVNLHSNVNVVAPYEIELNATASYQQADTPLNLAKNTDYTLTYEGDGRIFFLADGGVFDSGLGNGYSGFTFNTGNRNITLRITNSSQGAGRFTIKNPMLVVGKERKSFTPRNPSYLYAETTLASVNGKKDVLYKEDGRWKVRKRIKTVELDGSFDWYLSADGNFSHGKRVVLKLADVPYSQLNASIATKYDGGILSEVTGSYTNVDNESEYMFQTNSNLIVFAPLSKSGWLENYTPTNAEIKAYFNGWKVKTADETGKPTAWVSVVDGTDAPTQTIEYVSANRAPNYTPYKLSYVLSSPITEEVNVEGDIVADGLTQMEVGSGVIVREKVEPSKSGSYYVINAKQLTKTYLDHKPSKFIALYENNKEVDRFNLMSSAYSNGAFHIDIPETAFDPNADYYVTYIVIDKHRFTTNPVNVKAIFAKNIRSAHDDLAVKVAGLTTDVGINIQAIAELYKRVRALGG